MVDWGLVEFRVSRVVTALYCILAEWLQSVQLSVRPTHRRQSPQVEEEAKAKEDRPVKDIFNFAMLTTSYKRHGGRDIGIQQSKGNCAATFFSKMKPMIEIKCAHGSNS